MNDTLSRRFFRILIAVLLAAALSATARAADRTLHVSYVSASAIYVDAGRDAGLEVGERLRIVRDGAEVAVVEVAWVAEHSSSCILISEIRTAASGDVAVLIDSGGKAPGEPSLPEPESPEPAPTVILPEPPNDGYGTVGRIGTVHQPWAKTSGSISVRFQTYQEGVSGRGFDESTGRINFRVREINGGPLEMRARLRSRDVRRDGLSGSDSDDRLYELSLTYDPPEGRFAFQVGRLGASPFISLGYLDGVLAAVRFRGEAVAVGAFYGLRPEIAELGFDSAGRKYGSFVRLTHRKEETPFYAEAVIAGIGEYFGGEVDREYVSIESRLGARRWSFSQLAEIDLNSGWRKEVAGASQQVSNLSVSGWFRATERLRLSLSYDRRQRFRTLDTRPIPEEQFDDKLRQGLRLGFHYGKPRGLNVSATVGSQRREGDEPTTSLAASIYHTGLGGGRWLLGADYSGYQGETVEGSLVTLRIRRVIGRHDIGLVVGTSTTTVILTGEGRNNEWARLTGTLQLPRRFYVRTEIEYDVGDDLEGQRLIVELGRRF